MRRVPIDRIQKGAKLGRSIYNSDGKILARQGSGLNDNKRSRLNQLGFDSVYITDVLSGDIIEDMISPELRLTSVKQVKDVFDSFDMYIKRLERPSGTNLKEAKRQEYESAAQMSKVAIDLVSELLNKKHQEINMVDIKNKEGYLYQHSVNVAVLSVIFGVKLGLNQKKLEALATGSLLHDIGYNFLDYDMLKKKEFIDTEAKQMIHAHPQKGYDYLKDNMDISAHVRLIVLQHHEWMNGSGYPNGIMDKEISDLAKIVAICDVYDALTSDRPHRKAFEPQEANERMMVASIEQLDAELVSEFIKIIIPYPIGTVVRLTNGEIGVVEEIDLAFPLRPKIKIVKQIVGKVELYTRDLMKEQHLLIENVEYEIPEACLI